MNKPDDGGSVSDKVREPIPWRQMLKDAGVAGPWDSEPDRAEWRHAGLPCLARRSPTSGNWCGYVAIPPGHPLYGKVTTDVYDDLEVHGGITYSAIGCRDDICHVPQAGESDNPHWIGFDTLHAGDLMLSRLAMRTRPDWPEYPYRDLAYVKAETNRLAEQVAELAK